MVAMTVPRSDELPPLTPGPITRAELDAMPDDGRRHELLDGMLLVTPAPTGMHQVAVIRLARLLGDSCPPGLEAIVAPFDVALAKDTVLQPDVLVAPWEDVIKRELSGPPLLAVEVLSPSTRRYDLLLKRSRYEAAGTPSYWVVDPDEPSVIAWELRDGAYADAGRASGDDALELTRPYPVRVVPAALVAPR
ncbi:Endonuclease, Uma2 family (restriction endonuclease fold) [Jiangella alba]|uniref:Endonuclease, Uma2 family (Restriction endonuclease fold) n=2 Tax=Jiangella alba TaxID=561176 RepID=A0A1H5KF55_9ACTN|nr:Endonuclease, Uma2 family (restriction endonuclease fold) [Jiangella alba]